MHINALPVLACALNYILSKYVHCAANPNYLSEVIAKGNFLIALLLVSRMFEFTSLTPQIEFIYMEFVIFKDTRKLLPN